MNLSDRQAIAQIDNELWHGLDNSFDFRVLEDSCTLPPTEEAVNKAFEVINMGKVDGYEKYRQFLNLLLDRHRWFIKYRCNPSNLATAHYKFVEVLNVHEQYLENLAAKIGFSEYQIHTDITAVFDRLRWRSEADVTAYIRNYEFLRSPP
jgi:capsid portal protein